MHIYCDGSSGPHGMGCGIYLDEDITVDGKTFNAVMYKPDEERSSSPRSEVLAMYWAIYISSMVTGDIIIHSDNEYIVKTMNVYYPSWVERGMSKSSGKKPKHLDIITPMYDYFASQKGRIRIEYIPGHIGIDGNEKADMLAKRAVLLSVGTIEYDKI